MILATSLFFICQQFVGGWSHSTPHTDAQLIAAIEKTVARGEALNSAATIEGDKFWGWYDIHDFATLPETKSWIFFQHKIVADQDQKLPIRLGSDDGITVWLNGQVLLNHQSERGNNPSAEHIILPLEKGDNLLTIKIYNAGGACSFAINGEKAASPIDVDRAIRRGANFLIAQQMVDGSWGNHSASYRNGATALAVYTLLVSGIDPQTAAVQKGLSYLSAAYPEKTYSASCQLMALAELNNPAYYDQMEVIASDLMSWQEQNGSWAYPEGSWDLSCLQFALLGLRAATLVGIDVPAKIWRNATNGIILCASEPKGSFSDISTAFVYRPNGTETMSMTAAAMSSFEICRQQLGGKYPQKTRKVITRLAAEGIKWMAN
ncbi:MAG: hypothetical protein QGF46_05375, partial [Planctomycetota bacterium]|nr:hypothetical protein [Planctomycetota bacterium]